MSLASWDISSECHSPLCYLEFALEGTGSQHGMVAGFHLNSNPRKFVGKVFTHHRLVLTLCPENGPITLALVDNNSGRSSGFTFIGVDLTFLVVAMERPHHIRSDMRPDAGTVMLKQDVGPQSPR